MRIGAEAPARSTARPGRAGVLVALGVVLGAAHVYAAPPGETPPTSGAPGAKDGAPPEAAPPEAAPPEAAPPEAAPIAAPLTTTLTVPAGQRGPTVPVTLATTPPGKLAPAALGAGGKPTVPAAEAPRRPFAPLAPLAPFLPLLHPTSPGPTAQRPSREPPRSLAPPVARGPAIPIARREEPVERVPISAPSKPAVPRATALPEEVVLRAMASGQSQFTRCWDKAQLSDQVPSSNKISLHLELDATGKITAAQATTDSPKLAACLVVRARQLTFPAPGKPAVVDLPLMFR